ncbi:MAG: LysM domain-containing protein [Polyangiaceae bacterium]
MYQKHRALVRGAAFSAMLGVVAITPAARAYPHIVQPGETLAQIAERAYGLIELERVLVAANGLDAGSGVSITPGMRLEIPALSHRRVNAGETWAGLAAQLLGDPERADVLAAANDSNGWMPPAEGTEIVIPYNLRVVVGPSDSLIGIAQRFLGVKEKAWMLDRYNHLKGDPPKKGDVVLVPLSTLKLSDRGREDALSAEAFERSEGGGSSRDAQKKADNEMPALLNDFRSGRYVDAVTKGAKMLSYGELSKPQMAMIHKQLVEAYVALDAPGLAGASCRQWRELDPTVELDPTYYSPKILDACELGSRGR